MRLITTQSSNRLREKLCYIALDYDTVLTSTTESSDMIRPTYSQTETTLLSTVNVSVARICCLSQISLVKSQWIPRHFFPLHHEVCRRHPQGCTRMSCCQWHDCVPRACGARDEGIDGGSVHDEDQGVCFTKSCTPMSCCAFLFFSACFSVVSPGDTTMFHEFFW